MSSKNIIAVTGATGSQGGSVVRFLLDDGTFAVRALTRNPESPAAKELAAKGVEVVKADYGDPMSLKKAFTGAYGVFGVTNFWESDVGFEGEISHGKMLVDAAKETGVIHFVWSTLDSTPQKASHWESKAQVDQYLKNSGVRRTSLYTSFYLENYTGSFRPNKRSDGGYDFSLPVITDARFAVFSVAETGAFVRAAFLHPETWLGEDMRIATDFLSARETAEIMAKELDTKVHVLEIDAKAFDALKGDVLSEEMHANFAAFFANPHPPFRDPVLARQLYPAMKTVPEWMKENAAKILS